MSDESSTSTWDKVERKLLDELQAIRVQLAGLEAHLGNVARLERRLDEAEGELEQLHRWRATFLGEKGERDRAAQVQADTWRRVATAVLIALILGAGGAGITIWKQASAQDELQRVLLHELTDRGMHSAGDGGNAP